MTAKQEFYLLCMENESQLSLNQVREFTSSHHSVQWRKNGRSNIQVRFNDHESWMDVSSFADNYHNKVCKQLNDLMLSSSKIITHGDLWKMTSAEFKKAVTDDIIATGLKRGVISTPKAYEELKSDYDVLEGQNYRLKDLNSELISDVEALQAEVKRLNKVIDRASHTLQIACSSMVVSKDKVREAIEVLERS